MSKLTRAILAVVGTVYVVAMLLVFYQLFWAFLDKEWLKAIALLLVLVVDTLVDIRRNTKKPKITLHQLLAGVKP